jgi:hypothetical protein
MSQAAGAVGVIIEDDFREIEGERYLCSHFDQLCFPGSKKVDGEGFSSHDLKSPW